MTQKNNQIPNKRKSKTTQETNATREMSEQQRAAICYKSNILQKYFDSYEELVAAENKFKAEQAEKEKKALEKKAEAQKVEDAFKAVNAAKQAFNEGVTKARDIYTQTITAAGEAYSAAITDVEKELETAENAYNAALKEFTDKHPEGYHVTLRDGDIVKTISRSSVTSGTDFRGIKETLDGWKSFFDKFFQI